MKYIKRPTIIHAAKFINNSKNIQEIKDLIGERFKQIVEYKVFPPELEIFNENLDTVLYIVQEGEIVFIDEYGKIKTLCEKEFNKQFKNYDFDSYDLIDILNTFNLKEVKELFNDTNFIEFSTSTNETDIWREDSLFIRTEIFNFLEDIFSKCFQEFDIFNNYEINLEKIKELINSLKTLIQQILSCNNLEEYINLLKISKDPEFMFISSDECKDYSFDLIKEKTIKLIINIIIFLERQNKPIMFFGI